MSGKTAGFQTIGNRWSLVGAVTAAAAVVFTATVPASAASAGAMIPVNTQFHDDGTVVPATMACETIDGVPGVALEGHATFTGGWQGTSVYTACLYVGLPNLPAGTEYFYGTETFTGSVNHCGTGTMSYQLANGYVWPYLDPTTGRRSGQQNWKIIPGEGSGDLAKVSSGSGVGLFTISPTGENDGTFIGNLGR